MDDETIKKYSAKNIKFKVAKKYGYEITWVYYAFRIGKNLFFRSQKSKEQDNTCVVCNSILDGKICLHHIDYDHICQLQESIVFRRETKSGRVKTSIIPNCEKCFSKKPEYFIACSSRTVMVHNSCHGKLHNENKIKKNRKPIYIRDVEIIKRVMIHLGKELVIENFEKNIDKSWKEAKMRNFYISVQDNTGELYYKYRKIRHGFIKFDSSFMSNF